MLVGIVFYLSFAICCLIDSIIYHETSPETNLDTKIETLKNYKALKEERILTKNEYEFKKSELLRLAKRKKDIKKPM